MKAHQQIGLVVFLVLLSPGIRAQESEPKSPLAQTLEPPVTLNGQGASLVLQSEKTPGSHLSGGIGVVGTFNDNALLSITNGVGDFSYLLQPSLNYQRSTPVVDWNVSLQSSFALHQQVSYENQSAEVLRANVRYRLARYLTLRIDTSFSNTNGLLSAINPATSEATGLVERPNNSLLIPFTQRTVGSSDLLELNYQFSSRSIVGARGTYSILDFPDSSKNPQFSTLYNTRAYSGEIFVNHQMSAKQWVGITLRTQDSKVQSVPLTKVDSLLLFYAINLNPRVTVSLFSGPERFDAPRFLGVGPAGSTRQRGWTVAEGATLSWEGSHTGVAGTFSRQISDGGGLSSAVTSETASMQIRRQLRGRRDLSFGLLYARNDSLEPPRFARRGLSGTFQFQQRLAKGLVARAGYTRNQQDDVNGLGTASANLVWVSLSCDFSRPLGQ